MTHAPFRQVHLDFHTSEHIPDVGLDFDAGAFAKTLKDSHVESVVLFAKCHHGWSYYDTELGERHPNLGFDLLRRQYDACRAEGLKTPIYISVGWDELAARQHQDWRQIRPDGQFFCLLGDNLDAAWSYMCVNGPYLDALCAQIEEVVQAYPEADGLWLDILRQEECCCVHCQASMRAAGLDFLKAEDRKAHDKMVVERYFERTKAAAQKHAPGMGVFHNTAMVPRGDRAFFDHFSHMEIEAVPTGGWGYDHLPMSARYLGPLGHDPLGVTVRFHIVWGELGGYKTKSALQYEANIMLAHGCRVCIGDQLDPGGTLDASAYTMIESVFAEVADKEPYCVDSQNIADIGVLSSSAVRAPGAIDREERHCKEDEGALKVLQEGHYLFDIIDQHSDFSNYKLVILPDRVRCDAALGTKLSTYVAGGGKVLLTGESGLTVEGQGYAVGNGAQLLGQSPFDPTFILPKASLQPDGIADPFVFMGPSLRLKSKPSADSMGDVYEPHFNRSPHHFNGHMHAPAQAEPSGYVCGVRSGGIVTLPHFHFTLYRTLGAHTIKAFLHQVIDELLGADKALQITGFPASGTLTLRRQPKAHRSVLHLLYGAPRLKGMTVLGPLEAIDDLPALMPAQVSVALGQSVSSVATHDGRPLAFTQENGLIRFETPSIEGHLMLVITDKDEP